MTTRIHTHYDNLKVARNAPVAVIKAAYKALAQQYHPDKNPSPDAVRIMQMLNDAWEVLSDEKRRASHDAWIAEQESPPAEPAPRAATASPSNRPERGNFSGSQPSDDAAARALIRLMDAGCSVRQVGEDKWEVRPPDSGVIYHCRSAAHLIEVAAKHGQRPSERRSSDHSAAGPQRRGPADQPASSAQERSSGASRFFIVVAVLAVVVVAVNIAERRGSPVSNTPPVSTPPHRGGAETFPSSPPIPAQFTNGVPDNAPPSGARNFGADDTPVSDARQWSPNGRPFPTQSGYLDGMKTFAHDGPSTITIDNTRGASDVYVKLCRFSQERCNGLRHVFIARGQSFRIEDIAKGAYEIRYRNLETGRTAKSELIQLKETETLEGIRYSNVRLTLYAVKEGNSRHTNIPEEQF